MIDRAITAEEVFELIENREVTKEIGIKLIENYGIRQQQTALSELQEEYGGYTEEIEQILKRVNTRLDELFREIAGVEL